MDFLLLGVMLLVAVVGFLYGMLVGWRLREKSAANVLNRYVDELQKEVASNLIRINIEKHDDKFYVYNKDTNEFMVQGSTKEEVENMLMELFPGKRFGATQENLIEVGFYHDTV